ncbi:oxygen-independent coproporphyrinogen III oxidase [uncultured Sunxiuqinia sp.]|uniref:oxygen-independent coproporphyrinogen III oxidase n=1 Tax=uncultured Sunxiuqinia sp. TaxID=1573825 RepID=UPI002AA7240B|nr:oxygen-independent coproporphyrinogen III oxidase [uncultured Sunxiuqinia sp.]
MKIPVELIEKYNVPVPRYTSYPPANFFCGDFETDDYLVAVEESNKKEPQNISIYLHIPFCTQLCLYCGCNTHITKDEDMMKHYMEALKTEIHMLNKLINHDRKISQIHWGGGTPNVLPAELVGEVMAIFHSEYQFIDNPEIAIECNPALLDQAYIDQLVSFGFNRISLGVQDFQEKVLNAVRREVPEIPISELVHMIRQHAGVSVNLDFIYGLPYQTVESFGEAIEKAIVINPDRLVTFSYAHVPWVKKAQKKLEDYGLPAAEDKVKMFEEAWSLMTNAGYVPIGLDHYAKPNDDMAIALRNRSLHRNFQGYCTRETTGQVYAFGVTGISQLEDVYAQNARTVKEYIDTVESGSIKIVKGYSLSETDKIIRQIINEIMCNQFLSWAQIADQFQTTERSLKKLLDFKESKLDDFVADELLTYTKEEIFITDLGRFFLRNIAAVFDVRLEGSVKKFSKSV